MSEEFSPNPLLPRRALVVGGASQGTHDGVDRGDSVWLGQIKNGSLWFISRCRFPERYRSQRSTHLAIFFFFFCAEHVWLSAGLFQRMSREGGRHLNLKNLYAALPQPGWSVCHSEVWRESDLGGDFGWISAGRPKESGGFPHDLPCSGFNGRRNNPCFHWFVVYDHSRSWQ